jgi:hypothetical protein
MSASNVVVGCQHCQQQKVNARGTNLFDALFLDKRLMKKCGEKKLSDEWYYFRLFGDSVCCKKHLILLLATLLK